MKEHEDKAFLRGKLFLGACLVFLSIWSWQVKKNGIPSQGERESSSPHKNWAGGKSKLHTNNAYLSLFSPVVMLANLN